MPAVKVRPSSQDAPRVIRVVKSLNATPPVEYEPDLVRVRAMARGYYAVKEVMKDPRDGLKRVVRNDILRNVGDVFDMDTADMRTLPLGASPADALTKKEHPHFAEFGTTEIETGRGQFELPSWVTLADESGVEVSAPEGHQTTFGKKDGAVL